jgi:hypothetical protein
MALAASACGNDRGPPPITNIAALTCSPRPALAEAKPVPLDSDKAVTVTLDGNASCLEQPGGLRSLYGAFKLPDGSSQPVLVSVTSTPLGAGLFSPHVLMLDERENVVREIARDAFMFHGNKLYVGIRLHPEERYLIVASDPQSVGSQISRITESTSTAGGSAIGGGVIVFYTIHSGSDRESNFTYSHNGTVTVSAEPMPKAN